MPNHKKSILILGVGNNLLTDDGFGIHVAEALREAGDLLDYANIIDGGTIGLNLLPDIENAEHLIIIDAAELGLEVASLRLFEGAQMDEHLSQHKSTVHEVAIRDLLFAARFSGHFPKTRNLVCVQPKSLDWGLAPSAEVAKVVDEAAQMVRQLVSNISKQGANDDFIMQ